MQEFHSATHLKAMASQLKLLFFWGWGVGVYTLIHVDQLGSLPEC